jgi:hypothetical protein
MNRQTLNEMRARALLNNRTVAEHLEIILIESEMSKAEKEADCSAETETIAWLPIKSTLLSKIRAVAKRHGTSVKQAIVEAITEDVAFWHQKGPYPFIVDTVESTVEAAPTYLEAPIADPAGRRICLQCGHRWKSRTENPGYCPHCKSMKWNEPKEPPMATDPENLCEECADPIIGGAPRPLCETCLEKLNRENEGDG